MATIDVKYLTQPHDGTPGKPWEDFEERLLDVAAGKSDDRGWSLADCLNEVDEGSAGGPAMPGGAADLRDAESKQRKRLKQSYALIATHVLDPDHRSHMTQNHFQNGPAAWTYLKDLMREPVTRLQLRDHDKRWDALDILSDVGVNANSIVLMTAKIKAVNAKRPAGNQKDQTECTEKLLELIFTASRHFSESATVEFNAAAGLRRFSIAAGAAAGHRDFNACTQHYHTLWKSAVENKLPGFHVRAPSARPLAGTRQTLESGMAMLEKRGTRSESALVGAAGGNDFEVPRSGSPSKSLALLASVGDELAKRHGTTTTTDWSICSAEELCAACDGAEEQFETVYLFDADDTGSVEMICDCCRGLGHMRRVCPSNRNRSSS